MNITLLDGLPKVQPMVNNLAEYRIVLHYSRIVVSENFAKKI